MTCGILQAWHELKQLTGSDYGLFGHIGDVIPLEKSRHLQKIFEKAPNEQRYFGAPTAPA
jgi:hypothetical protein